MNEDCVISEYFDLPSRGKVYGKEVNPRIKMRSMRTAEEMRRLSPSDHPYENMCSIIDDCTEQGPGISSYNMCMADYTAMLYRLRVATYGPNYNIASTCPLCKSRNEGTINLDELTTFYDSEGIEKYSSFVLPRSKKTVEIGFQTPKMMDEVNDRVREFKRKSSNKTLDATLLFSLENLIKTVDGRKPDPIALTEWLRTLDMIDTNTIWRYSEKLESCIGVDRIIDSTCDVCGLEYKTQLSIGKDFFRPTLDI